MATQPDPSRTIKSVAHASVDRVESLTWSIGPTEPSEILVVATGEDTGLRCTLAEHRWPAGSEGGLHAHRLEDEGFYVLEGSVTFSMPDDGLTFVASAGEFVWHPRNRRHGYRVDPGGPARVLQILLPGTRLVPDFFRHLEGERGAALTDPAALTAVVDLARDEYGVVFDVAGTGPEVERHPGLNGLRDGDGRSEGATGLTNAPFHSTGTTKLPMLLGDATDDWAKFHAFGRQTANQLGVAELCWSKGIGAGGSGKHVHMLEDEGFYVIEGEMTITFRTPDGDRTVVAGPGECVWLPRETAHTAAVTGDPGARYLVLSVPGSTLTDYFYRYCTDDELTIPPKDLDEFARINAEYEIYWYMA